MKATRIAVIAAVVLLNTIPAGAQDALADLRRELAALRSEVQQLRDEVQTLRSTTLPAPGPNLEILQSQVAELAQTKVESTTRFPVRLFGAVHTSVFTNSANANWLDNPNVVAAPPADGMNGTLGASLRQTRIGFASDGPLLGSARTSALVAMDFLGGVPAYQTGQTMGLPRLLVGYARIEGSRTALEIGQDHVILAPRDPTSLADFAFPAMYRSGNLYLRAPQVRVERSLNSRFSSSVGIVAPVAGDLTGVNYLFVPPALAGERSRRPAIEGRLAYGDQHQDAMRSFVAGAAGHLGWERQPGALRRNWATAIDAAARRGKVAAAGEAFIGDRVDAFGGALGQDARSAGGWGELQIFPNDRLTVVAGFGVDRIDPSRASGLPRSRNQSASSSLIFSLVPEIQTAVEYHWLKTLTPRGALTNHHVDFVFVHKF